MTQPAMMTTPEPAIPTRGEPMNGEYDKWRELSRRAGERHERPSKIIRFSRPLMIFSALALIVASVFHLI